MESSSKPNSFNGKGDVNLFIKKVQLWIALKGYTEEKAAQALASRLEKPAFNVYLRMSEDDQKDIKKVIKELKQQYELGNKDREQAQALLNDRVYKEDETVEDYAFDLNRLVTLAYPTFQATQTEIIRKDFFTKGLHPNMQLQLKSTNKIKDSDLSH